MSKRLILIGVVLMLGCSAPAEMAPGIYDCWPSDPGFTSVDMLWFDTRDADIRVLFGNGRTGLEFTDSKGRRLKLYEDSPGEWECVLREPDALGDSSMGVAPDKDGT